VLPSRAIKRLVDEGLEARTARRTGFQIRRRPSCVVITR
jgi:hypothetical protein